MSEGAGSTSMSQALLLLPPDSGSLTALPGVASTLASFRTPSVAFLRLWAGWTVSPAFGLFSPVTPAESPLRPSPVTPITALSHGMSALPFSL